MTPQEQLDIQKENEAIAARNLARSSGDAQAYLQAGGTLTNGGIPTLSEGTEETYNKYQERYSRTPQVSTPTYSDTEQKAVDILSKPMETQSVEEIQAEKTRQAQAQIDALNRVYQDKLAQQTEVNKGQERRTSSVNTLTGLAGSTEAGVQAKKTEDLGNKQLDAIRNEQAVMISSILSDIQNSAIEEARLQTQEARQSASDILALRTQRQTEAVDKITVLSKGGVTAEGLKATDPESYAYLSKQLGGDAMVQSYLTLNRSVESIIDKRVENGKYIIAYQNPITGATRIETVDLGVPEGYSKTVDAGDRILAFPDNWSGDPSELITINKGLTPAQEKKEQTDGVVSGNIDKDVESIMNGTLNLQDVSSAHNYRATVARQLTEKFKEAKETGDIYGTMKASAAYDKEPSDTFLQSMEKVTNVLGQLGVLQENLTNGFTEGKIEGVKTGPLVGAFKSANPWSTEGQVIKAQLNAIVPNLARGVYGEVGVLTDNDIKTYSGTIPNLKSTEDIRNAVLYITVDMIKRNIENKIENQAAGQRDMSGYADIYKSVVEQSDAILSQISGASNKLTSPDGTQYSEYRSQLVEGEILIQRGNDLMAISEEELQPNDIKL